MRDKKGYLPAHVACSRHCSPEKLRMLLAVNPASLYEKTLEGHTLLALATSTATKSHPNYALIEELNRQIEFSTPAVVGVGSPMLPRDYGLSTPVSSDPSDGESRGRLDSNDSNLWRDDFCPPPAPSRKRKSSDNHTTVDDPATLLLHFSRHGSPNETASTTTTPSNFAEV